MLLKRSLNEILMLAKHEICPTSSIWSLGACPGLIPLVSILHCQMMALCLDSLRVRILPLIDDSAKEPPGIPVLIISGSGEMRLVIARTYFNKVILGVIIIK